jgi:hypothetical protein
MNLQEELKALKERIAELEELVKEEQEFPKDGDDYWYIGKIGTGCWGVWEDSSVDKHLKSIGNIFQTEEKVEFALEKLKVEAELRKFSRPFKHGRYDYYLFFDIESDCLDAHFTSYCPIQGAIYFESEEKVQQAIKSVGEDRIKKYIFEVGEY